MRRHLKKFTKLTFYLTIAATVSMVIGLLSLSQVASDISQSEQFKRTPVATETPAVSQETTKKIDELKPTTKGKKLDTKTITDGDKKTVIISETSVSNADVAKYNELASLTTNYASPYDIKFIDQTGQYPSFENALKEYMSKYLLWTSGDLAQMKELDIVDCDTCEWLGLYRGSYTVDSSGNITNAFGWITLNVNIVKSSNLLLDYMKVTLAHEYGHHYSLYYKWSRLNLPIGTRFPDEYYSVRSLPKDTTAPDYSKGWANCDAEIVAEDYSYIFSGYGVHAMASIYGYPNDNVKKWFYSLTSSKIELDSEAPIINIVSPINGAEYSGNMNISVTATDNRSVKKVDLFLDGILSTTLTTAPYALTLDTRTLSDGDHTLKAQAYDEFQSSVKEVLFKTKNFTSVNPNIPNSDQEIPVVTISDPNTDPFIWLSGNLLIKASASDNQLVAKMQIFINGFNVAEQKGNTISRYWTYFQGEGIYELKVVAIDASGNSGEKIVTIYKQNSQ